MIIKVMTTIYIDVESEDKAVEASIAIDSGLERNMRNFPHGEIVQVDVDHYEQVSAEEIKEMGLEDDDD